MECRNASGGRRRARSDAWLCILTGRCAVKTLLLAALVVLSCSSLFAQAPQSCPSGHEDMMNYFAMAYSNRLANYMGPGNANPIYTTVTPDLGSSFAITGQFLWIKSAVG